MSQRRRIVVGAALVAMVLCGANLRAAPFRPARDDMVVEVLPPSTAGANRSARASHVSSTRAWDEQSEARVLQQVRDLIVLARTNGDPRQLGRAEALLRAVPAKTPESIERLLLLATIDQSLHRFDSALRRLDAVVSRDPGNAQARLTRSTVLQLQGRYDAAVLDCSVLARVARPIVARTCAASVTSLRRGASAAYVMLDFTLRSAGDDESPAVLAWSRAALAGVAERAGRPDAAEANYRMALSLAPDDPFVRASYADLLLDLQRPREALALVAGRRNDDNLLLREVLARQTLRSPGVPALAQELGARFDVARQRGEALHLREEARFELHILGRAARALELARSNWQVQREPADARILQEAALAAGDRGALREARQWYSRTGVAPVSVGDGSTNDARRARS